MAKQHGMKAADYRRTLCDTHGDEFRRAGSCVMGAWVCGRCHHCTICDTPPWVDGYWNGALDERDE